MIQPTNTAASILPNGSIILAVKKSNASNKFIPAIVQLFHTPNANDETTPINQQHTEMIPAAFLRVKWNFSCKNAVETSCKDIVEVRAASANST